MRCDKQRQQTRKLNLLNWERMAGTRALLMNVCDDQLTMSNIIIMYSILFSPLLSSGLGIWKAGKHQCRTEGSDWRAEEREAAFDLHAKPAQAYLHCPAREREDARGRAESLHSVDQRRNLARLSDDARCPYGMSCTDPKPHHLHTAPSQKP